MKSSLSLLSKKTKEAATLPPKDKLRVTYQTVLEVNEKKYGSKIAKTIKSLTRQHIVVLHALANLFDTVGEEKMVSYKKAFSAVESEGKSRQQRKIQMPEFVCLADELEYYSFI